jgi:uncharacterized protein (DUF2141 family)
MRLFFFLFLLVFSSIGLAQKQYSLTVKVTGIENYKGEIEIALYKDPKKFRPGKVCGLSISRRKQ